MPSVVEIALQKSAVEPPPTAAGGLDVAAGAAELTGAATAEAEAEAGADAAADAGLRQRRRQGQLRQLTS